MARINVDTITRIDKNIRAQEATNATFAISESENGGLFQLDTYSNSDNALCQSIQFDRDNLGKFLQLVSSQFESFTIPLLDDKGEVKYGINWGNRTGRNKNQAYLDLPQQIYNSNFFPNNGIHFFIRTDDNQNIKFTRAQKDNVNGHALQTPDDNTLIGIYLRNRLSVKPGDVITKEAIERYGRNYITISKLGDFYFLDFFSSKKTQTYITKAKSNSDYRRYIAAIKSKPFLLLAGISGTGKSRIVRELARACWEVGSKEYEDHKPRNFEMVQVKPNWHDSSELIGYVSRIDGEKFVAGDFLKFVAKAWEEPGVPYFLCLDEMNLAPVEQYFAEYLSVVESRKNKDGVVVTDPLLKKSKDDWYRVLTSELTEDDELRTQFLNDGTVALNIRCLQVI
ncbi:MAG: NgoFVII family restriction endonuclease [Muribaculaceae bacterium]|nr:NgoFVII family restriction endonuclease [Muribaculaceae bacterium]